MSPLTTHSTVLFKSQELAHDLIINFLAFFGAQIEAHFVDDFDAVIAEPLGPTIGADGGLDASTDLVVHRRLGQLAGPRAKRATRALAAKATHSGLPAGRRF